MLIASIRQTSPGRLTVTMDDGTEIKSTLAAVTDMRLFSGKELDSSALEEFTLLSSRALARERALEYLSRRQFSRSELRKKLIEKGENEDVAEYCVNWLAENGLISDESYAAAVSRHYAAKGYGPGRIRTELSRRGISRELWEDAVDAAPRYDEKIQKFISARLKNPDDRDEVRKVTAALYRRGWSFEEIRQALRDFNAEPDDVDT